MIFELNKDGWIKLKEYIKTLKDLPNYRIQIISKDKARSIEQNRLYWASVLPAILYFINDYWQVQDVNDLHDLLKLEISKTFYTDLVYVKANGVISTELSTNFANMSSKEFNTYLDNLLKILPKVITINVGSIEELVDEYNAIK